MAIGFTIKADEEEDEYTPLYRLIIECPLCKDDLATNQEGTCSCENLEVGQLPTISKCHFKTAFTHFKTIAYTKEPPNIFEVLLAEELP